MPKFNFRRKDTLLFLFFVAVLHILLTYMFSTRAGHIEGTQAADTISRALLNKEAAQRNLQDIPANSEKESKIYRHISFLFSLPFDPIFRPVHERWAVKPLLEKEIPEDEYAFRANFISITTMVLNSLAFSFLVYGGLKIAVQNRKQG